MTPLKLDSCTTYSFLRLMTQELHSDTGDLNRDTGDPSIASLCVARVHAPLPTPPFRAPVKAEYAAMNPSLAPSKVARFSVSSFSESLASFSSFVSHSTSAFDSSCVHSSLSPQLFPQPL